MASPRSANCSATSSTSKAPNGSTFADQLVGNGAANVFYANGGDDAVDGGDGADILSGGLGTDLIIGGGGNDVLFGGPGADVIDGGTGIDTLSYVFAEKSIAVSLLRGKGGVPIIDYVSIFGSQSEGETIMRVENVVGSIHADIIVGSDGQNLLEGRDGSDTIQGCGGNDTIYGEMAPNSPVEEYVPGPDFTNPNFLLDCGCEDEGDHSSHHGSDDHSHRNDILDGGVGADIIYGGVGDDEICGSAGTDKLFGEIGNDIIAGGTESDVIDGGQGTDILYGGSGNDTISGGHGFDIVFGGEGTDTASYAASGAGVTVDLTQFWRNSGGDASSDLIGELLADLNSTDDAMTVLSGALFLSLIQAIGDGTDTPSFTLGVPDVLLGVENVIGSAFADSLTGNVAANVLNGGAGADFLEGGLGSDVYIVDNAGDSIFEGVGGGQDEVRSSVSQTLSANVELLTLTGSSSISGTGNTLDNVILGNTGNNVIDGGGGADKMTGGAGNDTYYIDSGGDRSYEAEGGGTDHVISTVSQTLLANVENLTLVGTAAVNGTGTDEANTIVGNSAANILDGRAGTDKIYGGDGKDTLKGGLGTDSFYFDTTLNAISNVDKLSDFLAADDTIVLDRTIFTGITANGALSETAFVVGTAATDGTDRIVYDQATGRIFYDADGNGAVAAILFAQVTAGTVLTHADFSAIA